MQLVSRHLFALFVFLFSSSATAFFGFSNPEIKLKLPDSVVEGNLVPVFILADNYANDPVTSLSLDVPSNPESFQRAFAIKFAEPQPRVFISTRFRVATLGESVIRVTTTTASGKTSTAEARTNVVSKPVVFTDPDSLATTFQAGYRFPTTEIGQTVVNRQRIRGDSKHIRISSTIFHPMLPEIGSEKSYYVDKVVITIGDAAFAELHPSPVMSNNLFFAFDLGADAAASAPVMFEWHDTRGHSFNGVVGNTP